MTTLRSLTITAALGLGGALCGLTIPGQGAAQGLAGPYLAGQIASHDYDYTAAAGYFSRALIADPTNPQLLESAVIAMIGAGDVERALVPARTLADLGVRSQFADLVILADLARKGDFEAALKALDSGRSAGPVVDGLYRAWSLVGAGRMSEASDAFDSVIKDERTRNFGLYHKALALALVGDFEGAEAIMSGDAAGPLRTTRRGVIAHAQILSQLERNADAIELLEAVFGAEPDAEIAAMRSDLENGRTLAFTVIESASDGIAEVFLTFASALAGETTNHVTLAYARMAEFIAPDYPDATLLCAEILERQGRHDLAIASYGRIPPDSPAHVSAQLGLAQALIDSDRTDEAISLLSELARSNPDRADIWMALGDIYRREQRYGEAAEAYDRAIATFESDAPGQWAVYYARGIAHERLKQWEKAEADFRKALELNPDQPSVLNYLGYSYLERKENYEEALQMIQKAVEQRPDNGAIVDSLGWALFRLGRYEEAVEQMERAVELMPVDPVVNDHLGDVYWAVGRKREAEFQWKRALSFGPETEEEAARIRRKLEVGLDAVLAEEGSAPLHSNDAD